MSDPSGIDVDLARRDTPGCESLIHMNNAGASLPPRQVVDAQVEYLQADAKSGGYELAADRADQLADTYAAISELVGAQPDDIALMSNATEAWQLAFNSIRLEDGDRILTSEAEYASNYIEFLRVRRHVNISVEPIPSDEDGMTSAAALAAMVDDRVRLIAITHVPTNGGLINPAAEIGHVANRAGIPYLLDVCQSVGQIDLDVDKLGCDFLSATGRKFLRGPRGTGFLYARRSILASTEPPVLDLSAATWTSLDEIEIHPDARRYETWEFNYAAVRGLGVAARYALS
ncbi:MAG TPA: aminotransferase class V-fold PLP-dependent enzyme, partial [Actinobacteria bacterium]|nr:aminotransferase class V-fold PLP-dependent enzyme [Actinomycetota bacterium]